MVLLGLCRGFNWSSAGIVKEFAGCDCSQTAYAGSSYGWVELLKAARDCLWLLVLGYDCSWTAYAGLRCGCSCLAVVACGCS